MKVILERVLQSKLACKCLMLVVSALAGYVLALAVPNADAQENEGYTQAYNICSPAAHFLTRQGCNYAVIFERNYTGCMKANGYSGEDDASGSNYYEGYMKAYNQCTSSSDKNAQSACNYGDVYHKHYNNCMAKHGFNEQGERMTSSDDGSSGGGFHFNY